MTRKRRTFIFGIGANRLRRRQQRGSVSVMTAVSLPVLLGVVALSVDVSYALSEKAVLQGAADNAARAAAQLKGLNGASYESVEAEALAVAAAHGYIDKKVDNAKANATVLVFSPPDPKTPSNYHNEKAVEVRITKTLPAFFSGGFTIAVGNTGVRAVAMNAFAPCLVALKKTSAGTSGIDILGGTGLYAPCAVVSNSPDKTKSVTTGGSSSNNTFLKTSMLRMKGWTTDPYVTVLPGGTILGNLDTYFDNPFQNLVDKLPLSAPDKPIPAGTLTVTADNIKDIYCKTSTANLGQVTDPSSSGTDATYYTGPAGVYTDPTTNKKTLKLPPGYYPSKLNITGTICSGVNLSQVVLTSGTYYLGGGFDYAGGTTTSTLMPLKGNRVTLALLNGSDFNVQSGDILLGPPKDPNNQYQGITVIGGGSEASSFTGFTSANIKADITGNWVLPSKYFSVTGNVNFEKKCLTLVAAALKLASSGNIGGACSSTRLTPDKERASELVE